MVIRTVLKKLIVKTGLRFLKIKIKLLEVAFEMYKCDHVLQNHQKVVRCGFSVKTRI